MTEHVRSLLVSEVFGPTIQGEGPHAGQRCAFLRLGACNLSCVWCDTAYTWDARRYDLRAELRRVDIDTVQAQIVALDVRRLVLSGGEPLLQDRPTYGLVHLLHRLALDDIAVDVETNGTLVPSAGLRATVDLFVVSPKLAHAGMDTTRTILPDVLRVFADLAAAGQAVLKIVCKDRADVELAAQLGDKHGFARDAVWIMPEGTTVEALSERTAILARAALDNGVNFTGRMHVALWGQERGH